MRTVIDASVAAKWYFPEAGSESAGLLQHEWMEGRRPLLAPELIHAELANLLWKKTRRAECDERHALVVLDLWEVDRPRTLSTHPLLGRALALASRIGHPVYDCLYVAAAIEHEAALATADRRLAKLARPLVAEVLLVAG